MADDAFALSPISARAAQPSDADYDAISEAFMETSRGRWFLNEYGKRNRNADTAMVLGAVARIESSLASQKPVAAEPGPTLSEVKTFVAEAHAELLAALAAGSANDAVAAGRDGAQVIREIAWTLRECGADSRICDLLDTHVKAIDASYEMMSQSDNRGAIRSAFDKLMHRIGGSSSDLADPEVIADPPDQRTDKISSFEETVVAMQPVDAVDAHDESVLDMIAAEMAAPDPVEVEDELAASFGEAAVDANIIDQAQTALTQLRSTVALAASSSTESAVLPDARHSEPVATTTLQPQSLGASLISRGLVQKPATPANDPFAAIRRMSQIEKIALFS